MLTPIMLRFDDTLAIDRVPPSRQLDALGRLFDGLNSAARSAQVQAILDYVAAGRGSLAGLFEARQDGATQGVVLAMLQPGRTAVLWPPRAEPGLEAQLDTQIRDDLLRVATAFMAQGRCRIAQAQLDAEPGEDDLFLRRAGYQWLADLLYMMVGESGLPLWPPTSTLVFEPYSATNHARLARLIERTYEDTLDCPQLNGVRDLSDVLAGYRATGQFTPKWWLLVREGSQDVGCLLCADHPSQQALELVYMGLVPEARGRGWGKQVVEHCLWLAREASRRQVLVAVDTANLPATRVYGEAGFTVWDRRSTYLRIFPE
ncbi:MAG: GNAT family N-acetyltransferase [Pirellulales bacterium]|nr:GNAT family N-acetyltransferase [Pirellulales bacterium]